MSFRSDVERLRSLNTEVRSRERLLEHFEIERELAARLRTSKPDERSVLYGELYSELFARLPDHPQHKVNPAKRRMNTTNQVAFLQPYLSPNAIFVEIGCGDAAVTRSVAPLVHEAVGVDVTSALINHAEAPANFRFVHTRGIDLGLSTDYADVVYSNQLMEHLHPQDARQQLREIYRVIKPNGLYICSTPSRLTGPHDISVYFGYEPTGFHMREYDYGSLAGMFDEVGFRSARAHFSIKGRQLDLPVAPITWIESLVLALPQAIRTRLAYARPIRNIAGVTLVGRK
jgi:SAM-dependent methyltransferase